MFTKLVSNLRFLPILTIFLLAAFLRFWQLDSAPPHLNWDEVSHGYNAYSILKTGKDEWGESFPQTSFRAFGDYKLPVYIYTLVPFVWLFGLNDWVVRVPAALAGVGTVILTFLLTQKLFNNFQIAAVSALLLAISPWHLFTSRAAFEANLAQFFVVLAIYLFLKGLPAGKAGFENYKFFIPSALFFGLSLFTYNSARIFVPLLIIALIIIFRKELKNLANKLVLPAIIFLLFAIPLVTTLSKPESRARFYWTTILDQGAINRISEARTKSNLPQVLNILVNNRATYFITHFIPNWVSHFSPQFLFLKGGSNFQYSIPGRGVLYSIEAVLIISGLFYLLIKRTKISALIFFWILLAPVAASATRESPNVLRTILILPTWQILASLGLFEIKNLLKNIKFGVIFLIFTILAISTFRFLGEYFGSYRTDYSFAWQYGYSELAKFLQDEKSQYDRIVITKKYGEPHEFLLFYQKIDPKFYQTDPNLIRCPKSFWFWIDAFNGYEFVNDWDIVNLKKDQVMPAACEREIKKLEVKKMLLVTSPRNFPLGGQLIKTLNFLDGKPAFDLVEF